MRVLVTGATGFLGTEVVAQLERTGLQVRALSRKARPSGSVEWRTCDLASGAGLEEAVSGADAVIHCATNSVARTRAVDVEGTRRLLDCARRAGVRHFLYPSIIGVDLVPYPYYRQKLAAERLVIDSGIPHSILRSTKFHAFLDLLLGGVARLPVVPLPTDFKDQPIDAGEMAARLVAQVSTGPGGMLPELAGPEVLDYREIAEQWLRARGLRRRLLHLPLPGAVARGFRAGATTNPRAEPGRLTWGEWLAARYGGGEPEPSAVASPR